MLMQSRCSCYRQPQSAAHPALLYIVLLAALHLLACSSAPNVSDSSVSSELAAQPLRTFIYTPAGQGPHPVVIDLHGCNGIWDQRQRHWLKHLHQAGFAMLKVDSFSARGVDNVCAQPFAVSPYTRTFDIAAAIAMVKDDPQLDQRAMFVLGSSHGGTSALMTNLYSTPVFSQLRGVIAYYPYCPDQLPVLNADLLILIGDADDWTPAQLCQEMKILNRLEHSYELLVYPQAHHSFDIPGTDAIYYGHQVRYNRAAATDSMRRTIDFMLQRSKR